MNPLIPDFLSIGHICHDKVAGGFVSGGAAAYSALFAEKMGFQSAVLTSFGTDFKFASQFVGIPIELAPSLQTTVFENIYRAGQRQQFLHQRAADLTPAHLPKNWRKAKIALLGPIANELSFDFINCFEETLVCACPQGWMRRWDKDGLVSSTTLNNWPLLCKADIISMSESDLGGDEQLIRRIAESAKIIVVTRGEKGATVFENGVEAHFPSYPTTEVDPTGAGDIFATAFTLRYFQTRSLNTSVAFAHAAASLSIEFSGLQSIPKLADIESRFEKYTELFLG